MSANHRVTIFLCHNQLDIFDSSISYLRLPRNLHAKSIAFNFRFQDDYLWTLPR